MEMTRRTRREGETETGTRVEGAMGAGQSGSERGQGGGQLLLCPHSGVGRRIQWQRGAAYIRDSF